MLTRLNLFLVDYMDTKSDDAIPLFDDARSKVVDLLAIAAIRYLTRPTEPNSENNSPTLPNSGLSSSRNDRSL